MDYGYNLLFFASTYVLPLACMAVCYVRMGRNLWRNEMPGEVTHSSNKSKQNKQKVVKMFAFMIVVFGICWLPYHVYFIYSYHNPWVRNFLVSPLLAMAIGYRLISCSDFSSVC